MTRKRQPEPNHEEPNHEEPNHEEPNHEEPNHEALLWICAASRREEPARVATEEILSTSVPDWPTFARMSIRHGIAPLAAHHLQAFAGHPSVPAEVTACFARMLEANGCRNEVMFRECARLLRAFAAAGIPCLILKGVGLALSVYPQPALRNFADIDLLVAPGDLEAAGAIAVSLGFDPAHEETEPHLLHQSFVTHCPEDILTATLPLEFEPDLSPEALQPYCHRILVEIHHGLFRDVTGTARRIDSAPLMRSPQRVLLPDGTEGLVPSPEIMLIHLADHAAGHGFARLMFFTDMALVLKRWGSEIDWDRVVDLAVRYEASIHLYRCLEFVRREFGAELPQSIPNRLLPAPDASAKVSLLQRETICSAEREFGPGIVLQGLLLSQSPRLFCIALRNILFPAPVTMRRLYKVKHPLAVALFYILRPIILIGHLAQVFIRRLRYRR